MSSETVKPGGSKPTETSSADGMALWITYINIILYALCYQLQRPVEPFLVKSLTEHHDDPDEVSQAYGRLNSFFSAIQTVGSPIVGILLDRMGIRLASAVVFAASAASYAILASASSMRLLFLSKVPTALQHAFLVAQATAATTTGNNAAARAQALGRMTTAYTIGATIGPAMGGILVDQLNDLYLGAKLAVFGSLVSVVLSIMYLPNQIQPQEKQTTTAKTKRTFVEELQHTLQLGLRPNLWPLLFVKVVGGIAASMHSTALPLVLTQTLLFEPSQLGVSMSSSMFAVAGFGAVCMAPLARSLGPPGMARLGLGGRAMLGSLLGVIVSVSVGNSSSVVARVVAASVLHALVSHVLATGLTTQTTGAVEKSEQGTLLGLEHGLFSMARIGAPALGTTLLATGGFWAVALSCGVVDILLVVALMATASKTAQPPAGGTNKWPDEEHSD